MGSTSSTEKDAKDCDNKSHLIVSNTEQNVEKNDFYEMFGLPRYCEMKPENIEKLNQNRKKLLRRYHPDKNIGKLSKEDCEAICQKIAHGYEILSSPELKRRYDLELPRLNGEESMFDKSSKWIKWAINVGLIACSIPVLVAAATAAAPAGLLIGGSTLVAGGMVGAFKTYSDPDCLMIEFAKNVFVGAVAGAVGGGLTAIAAPSMAAATALGKIAIASGVGAGSAVSGQAIKDGVDLTINACGGVNAIRDVRSAEQIFSLENGKQYLIAAVIGGAVGGVTQGVANNFVSDSGKAIATEIVDTSTASVGAGRDTGVKALNAAGDALGNVGKKTVGQIFGQKLVENGAGQATHLGLRALMDTMKQMGKGKSLLEAVTHASTDAVLSIPGAVITAVAGATLSTGIEYKRIQVISTKYEQLQSERGNSFNADGTVDTSSKTVGDDTFGRTQNEHVGERHIGSSEMAMARAKVSKEDSSMFFDKASATDSIKAAGQKTVSVIDKNSLIDAFNRNTQSVKISTDPAVKGTLLKGLAPLSSNIAGPGSGNIYASKGNVVVEVDMGKPVGFSMKHDPSSNTFSYAECTKVKACFEMSFNPATQQSELNLVTAYPVADGATFTNVIPTETMLCSPAANMANILNNTVNTTYAITSDLDERKDPLLHGSKEKEKKT